MFAWPATIITRARLARAVGFLIGDDLDGLAILAAELGPGAAGDPEIAFVLHVAAFGRVGGGADAVGSALRGKRELGARTARVTGIDIGGAARFVLGGEACVVTQEVQMDAGMDGLGIVVRASGR